VPVVLLVGISKGGFGGGAGFAAVPLLSWVMPLPQAAAILLRIDGVLFYRIVYGLLLITGVKLVSEVFVV
jgi:hypothetical protein